MTTALLVGFDIGVGWCLTIYTAARYGSRLVTALRKPRAAAALRAADRGKS